MHTARPLLLLAAALALAAAPLPPPAHAGAPMARTQAPGFYRVKLGEFEITVLSDGTFAVPMADVLTGIDRAEARAAFAQAHLGTPSEMSVNTFLVNTGDRLVLIDAGGSAATDPTLGALQANLAAAGHRPEQVDAVVITHMHGDHIGGLADNGKAAFPNATLHIDQAEVDCWTSEDNLKAAPEQYRRYFRGAIAAVRPYRDAGRLKPFSGRTALVPGITAVPTHGHTAGHAAYEIESGGRKLVLWGDLMHAAPVQFARPEVTIQFDSDSTQAAKQRQQAFADAAKGGFLVGAAHLPFPGLGYLRAARDGRGYEFVPINYSTLK